MAEDTEKKLNKREQYKARMKPYDFFTNEFESIDFESLGEGDRYYLQDLGIFNTDFLEDEFTIRLRNGNGGRFTPEEFSFLANLVKQYDLTLVITARSGFQLHDVYADDVAEIWHKLNDNGLTTWQSFGDNVRNIVTDVYDGVSRYSRIEVHEIIQQMNKYILKNPKYVGMLPRRVSIGISGNEANVNSFFANDIYFALARKADIYGFNVYMGGKNTEVAKDADIFLTKEEVFDFFKAFVETFYTYGSRFSRSKTRLFYLIESIGLDRLKAHILEFFPKNSFESAGELQLKHVDFGEFEVLKDGSFAYCYQSEFGRLQADELLAISSIATQESAHIRVGIDQNIYLIGLSKQEVNLPSAALSSTIVACAGNLCPYAVWSIKDECKEYLPLEMIYKNRIKIGFSGCAKGCGRHRHVDIGLIGLKTNNFGNTDGGARIFIGAEHDIGQSVARQLFSMVPYECLQETMELIIHLFELSGYQNFQQYAHHVLRYYSEDFLALWHAYNFKYKTKHPLPLQQKVLAQEDETALLREYFEIEIEKEDMKKRLSGLVKELWTVAGDTLLHTTPSIERTHFR